MLSGRLKLISKPLFHCLVLGLLLGPVASAGAEEGNSKSVAVPVRTKPAAKKTARSGRRGKLKRSQAGSILKSQQPKLDNNLPASASASAAASASAGASAPAPSPPPGGQPTAVSSSGDLSEILRYGARKHAQGNLVEAEAAFRHVLSRDPQNVDAYFDLGALAEQKGDFIGALTDYRAALALHPQDKQIKEAVCAMESALKNAPAFAFQPERPRTPVVPWQPLEGAPPMLESQTWPAPTVGQDAYQPFSQGLGQASNQPLPYQQDGVFQLGSSKADLLGSAAGQAANLPVVAPVAVPAAVPVVPSSPPALAVGRPSVFRSAANSALSIGLNYGLRAAGLHCPVCRMVRFHF